MKYTKIIPFLTIILAFALLLPTAIVKAEEKSFVGVSSVYEGQIYKTVNISLYIHGTEKIAGGSLDLIYDQTALTVKTVALGDQLTDDLTSVNKDQAGKVSLAWAGGSGKKLKGSLFTITASLKKSNEIIDLDIQNLQLFNEDSLLIAVDSIDGVIKPFKGKEKTHDTKVTGDKIWTIRLNQEISDRTVNRHTVRVKNSLGKEFEVDIKATNGNTFTVSPKTDYIRGTYTLEITEQVRGKYGSQLKEPVQYKFTVQ